MMKLVLLSVLLATLTGFQTINDVMVCDSLTAKAYHIYKENAESYCLGLKRCSHEIKTIPLAEATKIGRTPCSMCYSGNSTPSSIKSTTPVKTGYTQCTGKTVKGLQCKRMVSSASGRCYQH